MPSTADTLLDHPIWTPPLPLHAPARPVDAEDNRLAQEMVELPAGAHLCLLYDHDPAEQLPALIPFIAQALAQREQLVYIADDQTVAQLTTRLRDHGIDVTDAERSGALKLWTRAHWRQPGELDTDRKAAQVERLIAAAQRAGFAGIRFAIEMTWTLTPDIDPARLEHWEAYLNTLTQTPFPVRVISQYNRSRLAPETILAALHTHPLVILDEHVYPNLFYRAPLILSGQSPPDTHASPAAYAEWMIAQLKQNHLHTLERETRLRERTRLVEAENARRQIQDVLESIPEAFLNFDCDGRFSFVNAAAEELLGHRSADLVGRGGRLFHATVLGEQLAEECWRANGEHRSVEFDHYFEPRNRWLAVKTTPTASGGLSVSLRDITAQKLAESTLRNLKGELATQVSDLRRLHDVSWRSSGNLELEPTLREILRATLDVYQTQQGIVALGDSPRHPLRVAVHCGFATDFLRSLDGLPPGAAVCNACRERRHRIDVDDVAHEPLFASTHDEAARGGFRAMQCTPLINRDGDVIGVLAAYLPHAQPPSERGVRLVDLYAREAADAIEGATLREQAQRELIERRRADDADRRLAAIVESSDDAIISKDLNGVIRSWNKGAQHILGYTPAEAIGRPITMLIPPERQGEERTILSRLRRGEPVDHYETVRIRKDGMRINISLTVSPLRDADGTVIGASKIARDITERKNAEAALSAAQAELRAHAEQLERRVLERTASLREANTQMEEFSYSVSHDLRAPLRAIHTYAQILHEDYGHCLDDTGRDYLRRIERNSERMEKLTRDILTYSRVARAEVTLADIDLEVLVDDILSQHTELQAPAATIKLHRPLQTVRGHEPSLGQCLVNLLMNAVKFVPPGTHPRVDIRTEATPTGVRIWVEDNGVGIPPEYHSRLFQVFERLHQRDHYEGTGIGLAIVRKAMEKMNGRCGVESDGRHGSRFWLELPLP